MNKVSDLTIFWQLSIRLQVACFVGVVFQNDIGFYVLVVAQTNQDNISSIDPYLHSTQPLAVS